MALLGARDKRLNNMNDYHFVLPRSYIPEVHLCKFNFHKYIQAM